MDRKQRRQLRKIILAACVPVAIAVLVMVLTPSGRYGVTRRAPQSGTTASQPAARPLRIVAGREQANEVRIGYPHTLQGAVSAAATFLGDIGSTLDPDTAAAITRQVADPSYPDAPQQAAEGTQAIRVSLGLPPEGPVPQGASLVLLPVEYQILQATADQVTVLFLADYAGTMPAQGTVTHVGVFPLRMHWAGDWKMLRFAASDYSKLSADPGSPDAASKGWNYLEPAGG